MWIKILILLTLSTAGLTLRYITIDESYFQNSLSLFLGQDLSRVLAQNKVLLISLEDLSWTLLSGAIIYFIFKILLSEILSLKISEKKTRYTFNKACSILAFLLILLMLVRIWILDTSSAVVALGLVTAGFAVAFQDICKNFFGFIIIIVGQLYEVGDRIEIGGEAGDVIDIGLITTSLMEISPWDQGEQPTGRMTVIPNGKVIVNQLHNYTKDHSFIWDELTISLSYKSDWERAQELIYDLVVQETTKITQTARDELKSFAEKYYFPRRDLTPILYLTPSEGYMTLHVRYLSSVKESRTLKSALFSAIVKKLRQERGITLMMDI